MTWISSNELLCHLSAVICEELVGNNPGLWSFRYVWRREHGGHEVLHVRVNATHPLIPVSLSRPEVACHEWLCWAWDFHAWPPALCERIAAESHISFWLKGCQRGHQILFLTSCWWSRQFCFFILFSQKNIVIIFKLLQWNNVWLLFSGTAVAETKWKANFKLV